MLKTLGMTVVALTIAAGAHAQDAAAPALPAESTGRSLQLPPAPEQAPTQAVKAEGDDNPNTGWNRVRHGFYSGLVAGGIVGIFLVADCGHPECGPLLTLAAGAGAGIGAAIDALVDRRAHVPGVAMRRDGRDAPFVRGRRVAISFRRSW